MKKIRIFNYQTRLYEDEITFGIKFLNFLYHSRLGKRLQFFFTSKLFSKLYGLTKKTNSSKKEIPNFIENFEINDAEFRPFLNSSYDSFNDYFVREFKEGMREFSNDQKSFCAFCEGRYLVSDLNQDELFSVKGVRLSLKDLVQDDELAKEFADSYLVVCRLAPVDYHHFHFPDEGEMLKTYVISGRLDSVTPIATGFRGDVFLKNERVVSVLQTKNFKRMLYIEVGALSVGTIIQTHKSASFKRGERKGYFEFGGSTVICLIKKENIVFDQDIINETKKRIEVFLKLGAKMGNQKA